jgi:DNA-binding SARP family transcriptional activator
MVPIWEPKKDEPIALSELQLRILGPLAVNSPGGSVPVTGKKRRALLIRLLLSPNVPVPDDRLAFDLWDGSPPKGSSSTLSSHVSLLRKAIGADRVIHHTGGYSIVVQSGELDVANAEAAIASGHSLLRRGHQALAVERFDIGLHHWRGTALSDVDGSDWARGEIARLQEIRLGATESLLKTRLALGHHSELVAAAELCVRANPLREQGWAILMIALYRSGRQTEALRAYQRLRSYLADELGIDPSVELVNLEEAIVLQQAELPWPPESTDSFGQQLSGRQRMETATILAVGAFVGDMTAISLEIPGLDNVLATHRGRPIQSINGYAFSRFSSPTAAIEAAAALQEIGQAPRHPGVSIALAVGEISERLGDCQGEPVQQALTLATYAHPGEVLVTSQVRSLSGRNCPFPFVDAGLVDMGDAVVGTLKVIWNTKGDDGGVLPLLAAMAETDPPFVGRHSQKAQLIDLAARAASGARQIALISGEPGIGKSSLVSSLARDLHASGTTVLYGRCLEVGHPYQPFCEALAFYADRAPLDILAHHTEHFGGELGRLVPGLHRRVPDAPVPTISDPNTERFLAFRAAIGLLAAAADERPVVLILEDLHWADAGTLALLHHFASELGRSALMLVGTFRSTELTPDHALGPVLAALWRERDVHRFDLSGLSHAEVAALCRTMTGSSTDDIESIASALRQETNGNAFFVCELLRHRSDTAVANAGHGPESPSSNLLSLPLPLSLNEVISERIHHLGARPERILTLASVIGENFAVETLAAMAGIDEESVQKVLDAARGAAIVSDGEEDRIYTFTHALIRRVLYGNLGAARRRQLHARVAEVLESSASPPALLAHHYLAADEKELALTASEGAGYAALDAMAPTEAARWFTQTLQLLDQLHPEEERRRCDLVTQRGVALRLAGDASYREVLLDAVAMAERVGDGRRMATAALANTRGFYTAAGIRDQERIDALEHALQAVGSTDPTLSARLLATICSEAVFGASLGERKQLARRAKAAARRAGDARTVLETNNLVVETLRFPTELPERLNDTALALDLAQQVGDPASEFWAIGHRMRALVENGDIEEAEGHFSRMSEVAERLGQPVMRWLTLFTAAQWALLRGDTARGEEMAEEALQFGTAIGQPDAFNYYATQLSHARWQQGRLDEIVGLIEQGMEDNPGIPAYQGALARAYCQAGRLDEARGLLSSAAASKFASLPEDLLWTYGMATYAEVAIQCDDADAAAILYKQLAPFEDQISYLGTTCEGPLAHYLGGLAVVLDDRDRARVHLQSATSFAMRARSPYFACRSHIETGRLLAGSGDPAGARQWLETAYMTAEKGGFTAEARRAGEILATIR